MRERLGRTWLVVAIGMLAARGSGAQQPGSWSVQEDNGNLAVWVPSHRRADDNYTQGLRVSIDIAPMPWFSRLLTAAPSCRTVGTDEGCATQQITIGQEIYTPTRAPMNPGPNQRPYAGWLYAELSTTTVSAFRSRTLTADIGVIGPPSLAAWTQNTFHQITGLGPPVPGWRHQLPFEPGLIVQYGERYLAVDAKLTRDVSLQVVPDWDAAIGNVRTGTSVGARARFGLLRDTSQLQVYMAVGAHEQWVLHNIFLDGSTFQRSAHAQLLPWTSETDIGPGMRLFGYTVELRLTTQAREYQGGPAARLIGSVIVGHATLW